MKILLNPDLEFAAQVRKQLLENEGYCPCRLSKTPDTKCICKDFREQKEPGLCHCGLYFKTE